MGNIYFKESYDAILETLIDQEFYIFGNTQYAQIFFLYCKESMIVKNIKGFVLSDLSNLKDNRKVYRIHRLPIRDLNWLKENEKKCNIFLAAKEKTIQEQLIPMLEDALEGNWYYVSEFVNSIMYARYMHSSYREIINQYKISSNPYEGGVLSITDGDSRNSYSYASRVVQGVLPDSRIFNEYESIDELHTRQLSQYDYIGNRYKQEKEKGRCRIYLAKSHFDKKLKEDFYVSFTEEIQVGASLTDVTISKLKDNTGDNISKRNRDYCEMSAVYWAWKNDKDSDYIGLCHYRRRLVVDENIINYLISENYGAIYVIPRLIDGGIREEFVERNYFLTPEMWKLTEDAIKKVSPGWISVWKELESSFFLLPCNMFIMRRDVFEEYCSWAFAILEEVDRFYLNQGIQCNNRYLGYIAELLNTVYAMKYKETLKKGYVHMKMLESEN